MPIVRVSLLYLALSAMVFVSQPVAAQPLGTFSWQLQPFCNVVTVNVTQDGTVYTLDGYDNQCGAATRASAAGMAFSNPDATIGLGLSIVATPGGNPTKLTVCVQEAS